MAWPQKHALLPNWGIIYCATVSIKLQFNWPTEFALVTLFHESISGFTRFSGRRNRIWPLISLMRQFKDLRRFCILISMLWAIKNRTYIAGWADDSRRCSVGTGWREERLRIAWSLMIRCVSQTTRLLFCHLHWFVSSIYTTPVFICPFFVPSEQGQSWFWWEGQTCLPSSGSYSENCLPLFLKAHQ